MAFFGEGAANQGTFHEALNLAGLWKLPVVFICEDNRWAISVPKDKSTAIASNADRASAYGMPGSRSTTTTRSRCSRAAGEAIDRARQGGGPTLIEVQTDRYLGHFQGDAEVYRPKDEPDELPSKRPDPEARGASCATEGALDDARDEEIRSRAAQRVTAGIRALRARARCRIRPRRSSTCSSERRTRHGGCDQGTHADDGPGHLRGASARRWSATSACS